MGKLTLSRRARAWYEAVLGNQKVTHIPRSPLCLEITWSQCENRSCFLIELSLTNCFSKALGVPMCMWARAGSAHHLGGLSPSILPSRPVHLQSREQLFLLKLLFGGTNCVTSTIGWGFFWITDKCFGWSLYPRPLFKWFTVHLWQQFPEDSWAVPGILSRNKATSAARCMQVLPASTKPGSCCLTSDITCIQNNLPDMLLSSQYCVGFFLKKRKSLFFSF